MEAVVKEADTMPGYEHNKLVQRIASLSTRPEDPSKYANWIKAIGHLDLLRDNAGEDELIVFARDRRTFIHAVVVDKDSLKNADRNSLLSWHGNPFLPCASYEHDKRGNSKIYRDAMLWNHESLRDAKLLVFGRDLPDSEDGRYYEVLQEYSHLSDIHMHPVHHTYCHFDELGDREDVVSITHDKDGAGLDLVTFKRRQLDEFLRASNSVLVRMFEFMLYPLHDLSDWEPETKRVRDDAGLFYRRSLEAGKAGYYRGVQIIRPFPLPSGPLSQAGSGQLSPNESKYVEFIAWDFWHKRVVVISTDPSATSTHFQASKNNLPPALSPAFFRQEVLSRYKNDPDKYEIDEEHRLIRCRGSWVLQSYDVNEAGQVHAYICDLRRLPYREQQYWASCNQKPKAGISERAVTNDFEGKFSNITTPLEDLLHIVRRWSEKDVHWWELREKGLDKNVHVPNNRKEWAQSFVDLAKLVNEGFKGSVFYEILKKAGKESKRDKDKSILLMNNVLVCRGILDPGARLDGLFDAQTIRSKCGAHPRGNEAINLERNAEEEHGSFSAHFEHVCKKIVEELGIIERIFL